MSNGVIPKPLFSNNIYNKPEFLAARSPTDSISSRASSPSPTSRSTSPAGILPSPIDPPFVPVKLRVPPPTLTVNIPESKPALSADQTLHSETLPATLKPVRKVKMTIKIRPFKGLQNGIENPTEFLEELNWAYRREHKTDEPIDPEEKQSYFSETHRILFRGNLEDNAERWYSKLPNTTKGDWNTLKTAFITTFQMDEVDNEARIVELRLELANLKQGNTENIAEFVGRADVLAKELPDSQVDIGMAVARGILDPDHKEKLLFEMCTVEKLQFSTVKTLVKALYFSRGKDNPFDPS